jgi:hypothetical protein
VDQNYLPPPPPSNQPPAQPYISLSEAPYTGLDLGPWGTAVYWTFLVAWCAFAAYLIAVKRVQNKLVDYVMSSLYGTPTLAMHGASSGYATSHSANLWNVTEPETEPEEPETPADSEDKTDNFVLSQVWR